MFLRMTKNATFLVVVLFAMTTVAMARQQSSEKANPDQQKGQEARLAPQPYNPAEGLKTKVFEIKYGDPEMIAHVIGPLGSSSPASQTTTSHQYRTITVRDFPENLAAIDDAIKRLDKPAAAPQMLEFHVHILLASDATPGKP
ncbi:MAG: hypothetical protein ACREAC_10085, partial [Blastocatellia bacterium]